MTPQAPKALCGWVGGLSGSSGKGLRCWAASLSPGGGTATDGPGDLRCINRYHFYDISIKKIKRMEQVS